MLDPVYLMFFLNGACAVLENIAVRMLENSPQNVIAFDVNVNYVQPYSQTTYANDVKNSKLGAAMTAILNISYPSYSRGNYTPEKAEHKRHKKSAGRSFVSESA